MVIKLWWWPMALPFSLHRWCPFTFLTLAGVLIGWLAAPFSRDRVNGGEECEQRSESPLMLALKGPAAEKFWGLKILSLDISQLFEIKRKLCTPFKLDQINGINKVLWTRAGGQSIYGSIVDGQNYPEVIKNLEVLPDGCAWAAVVTAHGSSPGFKWESFLQTFQDWWSHIGETL